MKPYKCMCEIASWLFVVPLHGFILLCNAQVENCFADKQHLFLNVFLSEIREEKERDAASIVGFTSDIEFSNRIRSLSCATGACVIGERLPRRRTLVKGGNGTADVRRIHGDG